MLGDALKKSLTDLKSKGKIQGKKGKKKTSSSKAKEMLRDGTANGKKLSAAQKGLFGLIASGKKPIKLKK